MFTTKALGGWWDKVICSLSLVRWYCSTKGVNWDQGARKRNHVSSFDSGRRWWCIWTILRCGWKWGRLRCFSRCSHHQISRIESVVHISHDCIRQTPFNMLSKMEAYQWNFCFTLDILIYLSFSLSRILYRILNNKIYLKTIIYTQYIVHKLKKMLYISTGENGNM